MSELGPVVSGMFDHEGLIGGACAACGQRHFPRAGHCPWCGAGEPTSVRLSTEGRLWSWTTVKTAPPGYVGTVPFGFGVVELPEDGLHIVTLLTETDPERLDVGEAMIFTTVAVGDEASSWAFAPSGS
ncbi:MAG: Zn-ribbon domain-containing OB-fold protein [Acidimicrobiales bacterium]